MFLAQMKEIPQMITRKETLSEEVFCHQGTTSVSVVAVFTWLLKTFFIQALFHYFDVKLFTNPSRPVRLLMSTGINDIKIRMYK